MVGQACVCSCWAQGPRRPPRVDTGLETLGAKAGLRELLLSLPACSPRPKHRKQLLKVSIQRLLKHSLPLSHEHLHHKGNTRTHTLTWLTHTRTHTPPRRSRPLRGSGNLKQVKQRKTLPPSRRQHSALTQEPELERHRRARGLPAAVAGHGPEEHPARWWQRLPVSQKGSRVHGLSSCRSLINTTPAESVADTHYPGVLQVGRL